MTGGFPTQEDAIQTAIGHLSALLDEAQADGRQLERLAHLQSPGGAAETADFQRKVASSSADLLTRHAAFVSSLQDQIHRLRRYSPGN